MLCLEGLARKIGESMLRLSPGQRNQWEAVIVFSQHSVAQCSVSVLKPRQSKDKRRVGHITPIRSHL